MRNVKCPVLKPQGLHFRVYPTLQPTVLPTPARVLEGASRGPQPEADRRAREDHPSVGGALPPLVSRLRQRHRSSETRKGDGIQRLCAGHLHTWRR